MGFLGARCFFLGGGGGCTDNDALVNLILDPDAGGGDASRVERRQVEVRVLRAVAVTGCRADCRVAQGASGQERRQCKGTKSGRLPKVSPKHHLDEPNHQDLDDHH